jgi:citrate lyase subunit beta / citryl-CoA lyase
LTLSSNVPAEFATDDPRVRIPAEISRSWLLHPATKHEQFDEISRSDADQVVLDLEDAVDPRLKPFARTAVAAWLENSGHAWVRINDRTSPYWADDIDALREAKGLSGVMLAKVESREHVEDTFDRLGGLPVVALIESAMGIENSATIAQARGAFRLAFGSGDYRRDTGTSADDLAMAYPRTRLVIASRIGNLPGPIDGPTLSPSHPVIREQTLIASSLGLTGKLSVDTRQLAVLNETLSPTASDVKWAREFLYDFEARGREVRDGSDLPRLGRAQKIETLARAFEIGD